MDMNHLRPLTRLIPLIMMVVFLAGVSCEAQVQKVELKFDRDGPEWDGIGIQIYPWLKGGSYFGNEAPEAVYARLVEELGIRYARVMIRIDNQEFRRGEWDWRTPPGFYRENLWQSLATIQKSGIEPMVSPLFWPERVVADQTYPKRENNFIGSEDSYDNVVKWFAGLCENAPEYGFEPKLASIQNEPDNDRHLAFKETELRRVTQEVAEKLEELDCPIQLVIGDTATMKQAISYIPSQIHGVPEERVAALGFHTYGRDRRGSMKARLGSLDHPIWMTEQAFNELPHERHSWDFAGAVGEDFYRDVAVAGSSAWFLWSLGPKSGTVLHGDGWIPYAEVIGLVGKHVPAGAELRVAQESGQLHFLGWEDEDGFYLWVLNQYPTNQEVQFGRLNVKGAEAWQVTREKPAAHAVEGDLSTVAGDSARMFVFSAK